jgi:hypothetical protein
MNPPSLLARLAGRPRAAWLLFAVYAAVVLGWYEGDVVWWLALGAVGAAIRTLSAVGQVRRYKAWQAQWQAMGEPLHTAAPPPRLPKKTKRRRGRFIGAALLFLGLPAYLAQIVNDEWHSNDTLVGLLALLWGAVCLYLVFRFFRGIVRRGTTRHAGKAEGVEAETEVAPVAWLVGRPSFSPSCADAMRNLPEYSARLLKR